MHNDNKTIKYYIYARKSSESDERQIQSIEDQDAIMRQLGKSHGVTILETLSEAKSAKEPYIRPVFDELIKRVQRGEAQGILAWKMDRLSRNPVDSGMVQHLLQKEIIKSIITIDREYKPEDNALIFAVESGMANQYIRDLAKNVARGIKSKLTKGWMPCTAPAGYLNTVTEIRGENYIIKDPERFSLIRQAWDLMLTGNYTPVQILDKLNNEWGFRTRKWKRKGDKPMSKSAIYRMFSDVFYAGLFRYAGQTYEGKHEPMITLDEYDRVQALLGRKGKPRVQRNVYAYTAKIACGECSGTVSATYKRKFIKKTRQFKDYTLYYCTRARNGYKNVCCNQRRYTNSDTIDSQIEHEIATITIIPPFVDWALEILKKKKKEAASDKATINDSQEKALEKVQKQLDNLTQLRLRDLIDDSEFIREKARLKEEQTILAKKVKQTIEHRHDWIELTEKLIEFAGYAHIVFLNGDAKIRREILSTLIHLNCTLKDKILNIYKAEWFVPIEKQYPSMKTRFEALEPEKMLTAQGRNEVFSLFRPELRALVDAIGTRIREYKGSIFIADLKNKGNE